MEQEPQLRRLKILEVAERLKAQRSSTEKSPTWVRSVASAKLADDVELRRDQQVELEDV